MRPPDAWLRELIAASEALAGIVAAGRDQWDADPRARQATYWLVCVVGEAAKGYAAGAGLPAGAPPWSQPTRLRDRVIHRYFDRYFDIDDDQVWRAVAVRFPALLEGRDRSTPRDGGAPGGTGTTAGSGVSTHVALGGATDGKPLEPYGMDRRKNLLW